MRIYCQNGLFLFIKGGQNQASLIIELLRNIPSLVLKNVLPIVNSLAQFALETGILSKSQFVFIKRNRTSDAHIIIRNLTDKYYLTHKKGFTVVS